MSDTIEITWTYSPPDLLEERVEERFGDWSVEIDEGNVLARQSIPSDAEIDQATLRNELHSRIEAYLGAAAIHGHKRHSLSAGPVARVRADGRKDVAVFLEPVSINLSCGVADLIIKDADGNVVHDTRRDRFEERHHVAQLASEHSSDSVAVALLRSYRAAINDPSDEFLHLYEIREAVSKHFGGATQAQDALDVASTEWSRLGQLTCGMPLTQSRHRGVFVGKLKEATAAELEEARRIARRIVEQYLHWLDAKH